MSVERPHAGEVELGSPRGRGEQIFMVVCCVSVLAVGVWGLVWAIVLLLLSGEDDSIGTAVCVAILAFGLGLVWLAIGPRSFIYELWDRLFVGPEGVRAGARGRQRYRWSEVAGFETVPGTGRRGPTAMMLLSDGRRIKLGALREVDNGIGDIVNPGAVHEGVRQLSLRLRDASPAP